VPMPIQERKRSAYRRQLPKRWIVYAIHRESKKTPNSIYLVFLMSLFVSYRIEESDGGFRLCVFFYDFSLSILRKLFITNTSVFSSGNNTFVVVIDILTTPEFVSVSLETINWDGVNNV